MAGRFIGRAGVVVVAAALTSTAFGPTLAASSTTKPVSLLGRAIFPTHLNQNVPLVRLQFTRPVTAAELPALKATPTLTSKWQQIGADEVQAIPTSKVVPDRSYVLRVPVHFRCTTTCRATGYQRETATATGSVLWLQELLAKLNYLPVSFTATSTKGGPSALAPGTFKWRFASLPKEFRQQWRTGADTVIVEGAIKRFQDVENLDTTGTMDAATWSALLKAVQAHHVDPNPYDYVYVSQTLPETLSLFRNGKVIYTTLVNTGIAVRPTAPGTYPVYARYLVTTMSGTNPDGTHYSDPGIPWVSYFNGGDALHGFLRSSYGWPQSLGCVEMPYPNAEHVFPWTPIGTLVTVS